MTPLEVRREVFDLRRRIRKWEAQLREYDACGFRELARELRETFPWYRRKLAVLEAPILRVA